MQTAAGAKSSGGGFVLRKRDRFDTVFSVIMRPNRLSSIVLLRRVFLLASVFLYDPPTGPCEVLVIGEKDVWLEGKLYLHGPKEEVDRTRFRYLRDNPDPRRFDNGRQCWYVPDFDGDGLGDYEEDKNADGIFEPLGEDGEPNTFDDETDWRDIDTDDDGLCDGIERGREFSGLAAILDGSHRPEDPDSDDDGLPDGLEWGVTVPTLMPSDVEYVSHETHGGTDLKATFSYEIRLSDGTSIRGQRPCFIPDQDPGSFTSSGERDTNGDGVNDGAQDTNANGRVDAGEGDPASGYVRGEYLDAKTGKAYSLWSPPGIRSAEKPYGMGADQLADASEGPCRPEYGLHLGFQAPEDGAVPVVHIDQNDLIVCAVERLLNSRFWSIHVAWNQDPRFRKRKVCTVWIECPPSIGRENSAFLVELLPYPVEFDPPGRDY